MNKKIILASSAVSVAMLMAAPVFADTNGSAKVDVGDHGFGLSSIVQLFSGKGHDDLKVKVENSTSTKDRNDNDNENRDEHKSATSTNAQIKTGVSGTVTAVNGSTITLRGSDNVLYTINAGSASFVGAGDFNVSLADIRVGDTLVVRGTVSGTTVTATKIADQAIRARVFLNAIGAAGAGVVTSVNGSSFTVTPIGRNATTTVTTNGSTSYLVNGTASTSAALTVGSRVLIVGTTTSDTSISASLVSIFSKGFGFVKHMFHIK
ncbi:MAG: hypothetical protein JWM46_798 [Candidatus Kaiserbacteria bacterium]|nr:hypothetical protein [Candidatus Kaiserbacteria bacterium]